MPTLYVWDSDEKKLGRDAAAFIDAPYQFELLEGASHWLPEESPEKLIPLLLDQLAHHR